MDMHTFSQDDLDAIATKLNNRLRKIHSCHTPAEIYAKVLNSGDTLIERAIISRKKSWGPEGPPRPSAPS